MLVLNPHPPIRKVPQPALRSSDGKSAPSNGERLEKATSLAPDKSVRQSVYPQNVHDVCLPINVTGKK